MANSNIRPNRLKRLFDRIISGKEPVDNVQKCTSYLEAIPLQPDPSLTIERLASNEHALQALKTSLRADLSVEKINSHAVPLLLYLQDPGIAVLDGGSILSTILKTIVSAESFFLALLNHFNFGTLTHDGQRALGCVMHQLLVTDDNPSQHVELAETIEPKLSASHHPAIRQVGAKLKSSLTLLRMPQPQPGAGDDPDGYRAGGRHDNDFADYRSIAILPTADELACAEPPFLRTSAAVDDPANIETRQSIYLDHLFRMLREDLIYQAREELQIARGSKRRGNRRSYVFKNLTLSSCSTVQGHDRFSRFGLVLQGYKPLPQIPANLQTNGKRLEYLKNNPRFLKHGSTFCLMGKDAHLLGFVSLVRDENMLCMDKPRFHLVVEDDTAITSLLSICDSGTQLALIQVDVPVFAYAPFLQGLKKIRHLPLAEDLLFWTPNKETTSLRSQGFHALDRLVSDLRSCPAMDLKDKLGSNRSVVLDAAQHEALLSGLTQGLSVIQGPPGTGKSFIGAIICRLLQKTTLNKILVVTLTNHALDEFLSDLLDVGIEPSDMVRFGGKASSRTHSLLLSEQQSPFRFNVKDWTQCINPLKADARARSQAIENTFRRHIYSRVRNEDILVYLEFDEPSFFSAFKVPEEDEGMTTVGRKGKSISADGLLEIWCKGGRIPTWARSWENVTVAQDIWSMTLEARQDLLHSWTAAIRQEEATQLTQSVIGYNRVVDSLAAKFRQKDRNILQSKRIIAATTTGAAKYQKEIAAASPDIVLVEEAGELLEAHVVTSLGESAKQCILIGDHKQLRPKVNNYALTVEKGEGYDFNMSLFERLVLKDYPHATLLSQHRMRPEISDLVRQLTYPDLRDHNSVLNRPTLRGMQDSLVFVNHGHPEQELQSVMELRDQSSTSSKQNPFEAGFILKTVKYLAQQGYRSDQMVVLTPYLGQLNYLKLVLSKSGHDPVLNDLDSADLVQAGLMTSGAAKGIKKTLRIATIDNYQGEEADVVLCSLTRSNSNHDIGFMSSPQRLNVLLSRARQALILIGNSDTFTQSKKGAALYQQFFQLMKPHVYDGLPTQCQQHPHHQNLLSSESDFDLRCPEGGCHEPCGTMLKCGQHTCPKKCHQIADHSKVDCTELIPLRCPQGHDISRRCSMPAQSTCRKCERDALLAQEQKQKEFERKQERERQTNEHLRKMKELEDQITIEQDRLLFERLQKVRTQELAAKERDLKHAREEPIPQKALSSDHSLSETVSKSSKHHGSSSSAVLASSKATLPAFPATDKPEQASLSSAESLWQHKRDFEGVFNQAIDSVMQLTGLEGVKEQVLRIHDKVELAQRQGVSLQDERFNVIFLGNPGTGKTTVARLYAKYLRSVGVLPGDAFEETTGASLANEGVSGAKSLLQRVLSAEGGAVFLDEAYQLTSNPGGAPVLDYLLAEMENHRGKIVFILAGYQRQMEQLLQHNPGLASRLPFHFTFHDYSDQELLVMLERMIARKWSGRMQIEDGPTGLFCRIATRRLGRGRGKNGFGNARALENLLKLITDRQTSRIAAERRAGQQPQDLLLVKEDLIGPDPVEAMKKSASWSKLKSLIGLASIKRSVEDLYVMIAANYVRELKEEMPVEVSLNRVFLGSPGTGKTVTAQLYGRILADLGLLSNGEVVVKNPSDFTGDHLGASEASTRQILAATAGKVLVIDEAYMLYGGKQTTDSYKTSVIDTIVAEVQSTLGEDRAVLLLGYEENMRDMFQHVNPGLSRRFSIENAFMFEDFTLPELEQILLLKLCEQNIALSEEGKDIALKCLDRMKVRPQFGNGGAVENLISEAKMRYINRHRGDRSAFEHMELEAIDFDPDYRRTEQATDRLQALFADVKGCEDIVTKLDSLQKTALRASERGEDLRDVIPTTFVFKGPPGTGKTTTARKMGEVFCDMGLLGSSKVHECSASDLIGQYVGHTGPLVKEKFEAALGQILFVDEAYRMTQGPFAKEATDEIVGLLTDERFRGKLIVILAGYDQDMNDLLASNRGLSSRFTEELHFSGLQPRDCLQVLQAALRKKRISLPAAAQADSATGQTLQDLFSQMMLLDSWGNARDVLTLAQRLISKAYTMPQDGSKSGKDYEIVLTHDIVSETAASMLLERQQREQGTQINPQALFNMAPTAPPDLLPPNKANVSTEERKVSKASTVLPTDHQEPTEPADVGEPRDPMVPDEVWASLQVSKKEAADQERQWLNDQAAFEREIQSAAAEQQDRRGQQEESQKQESITSDQQEIERLKWERERARLAELEAMQRREALEQEFRKAREEEAARRKEESIAKTKLRAMGLCPAGFRWFKQGSGWRCGGGSHFVTNEQLDHYSLD